MRTLKGMSFEDFCKEFSTLSEDTLWTLWIQINEPTGTSLDIVDYSYECSMCGKPMPYRFCGMCTHCEQVWNS